MKEVKGYKGFDKDFKCKGKQYAENTEYDEGGGNVCGPGMMHFCETPLDVLNYYPILDDDCNFNRFAEVTAKGAVQRQGDKRATKKLKVGAELSLGDFIKASAAECIERVGKDPKASGDASQLAALGYGSQLAASGDGSRLAASGDASQLAASGDGSRLAASGYRSQLAASGYGSQLAASGDGSQLAALGYGSQLAASGYGSQLAALGYESVVAGIGVNNIAKCALGGFIVLAEWKYIDNRCAPVDVKAAKVDGEAIKANTWYKLVGGEFVEVQR